MVISPAFDPMLTMRPLLLRSMGRNACDVSTSPNTLTSNSLLRDCCDTISTTDMSAMPERETKRRQHNRPSISLFKIFIHKQQVWHGEDRDRWVMRFALMDGICTATLITLLDIN
jgi:hypothetical protein